MSFLRLLSLLYCGLVTSTVVTGAVLAPDLIEQRLPQETGAGQVYGLPIDFELPASKFPIFKTITSDNGQKGFSGGGAGTSVSEAAASTIAHESESSKERDPAGLAASGESQAAAWYERATLDSKLVLQQRFFSQPGLHGQAQMHGLASWLVDWYWEDRTRTQSIAFSPYFRWSQSDSDSNLIDLQRAYWHFVGKGWEFKAGVDIVFWGVTESRHLVDVVNQSDLVPRVDAKAKLGQPMLQWLVYGSAGSFELYLLPYFRERHFAGLDGRLTTPLPLNDSLYEAENGKQNLDFAFRWYQQLGGLDLGLSYFDGNNREPVLTPTDDRRLQPLYVTMQQLGLDLQWISNDWIWKLESIYRDTHPQGYSATTAGFEYTTFGVLDSLWNIGWIAEYQHDGRGSQPQASGQNDLFVGARLVLNDIAGSQAILGISQDLEHGHSRSGRLEVSRRVNDKARFRLDAWFFRSEDLTDPLYILRTEDYVQLSFEYYF